MKGKDTTVIKLGYVGKANRADIESQPLVMRGYKSVLLLVMDTVIHVFHLSTDGIERPDSIVVGWYHVTSFMSEWRAKGTCAMSRSKHLIANLSLVQLSLSSGMATRNVQNGYFTL